MESLFLSQKNRSIRVWIYMQYVKSVPAKRGFARIVNVQKLNRNGVLFGDVFANVLMLKSPIQQIHSSFFVITVISIYNLKNPNWRLKMSEAELFMNRILKWVGGEKDNLKQIYIFHVKYIIQLASQNFFYLPLGLLTLSHQIHLTLPVITAYRRIS